MKKTSIFKLSSTTSDSSNTPNYEQEPPTKLKKSRINNKDLSFQSNEDENPLETDQQTMEGITLKMPAPKSYTVTIDPSGRIHMGRPTSKVASVGTKSITSAKTITDNMLKGNELLVSGVTKDSTLNRSIQSCELEIEPTPGENPAPYTVIINQAGTLETVQTSPNLQTKVCFQLQEMI